MDHFNIQQPTLPAAMRNRASPVILRLANARSAFNSQFPNEEANIQQPTLNGQFPNEEVNIQQPTLNFQFPK